MIMALALMNITKIIPANVAPLIVVDTLLEKDLGGELKQEKKAVDSFFK